MTTTVNPYHDQHGGGGFHDTHAHHLHHHHHSYQYYHIRHQISRFLHKSWLVLITIIALLFIGFVLAAIYVPNFRDSLPNIDGFFSNGVKLTSALGRHGRMDYDGIDISHHQGVIDWNRVSRDTCVKFVYIKATEGGDHIDSFYLKNIARARTAGIPVGTYHYLTSGSSIRQQFRLYYSIVNRHHQDLVPMIDVEEEGVKGWSREVLTVKLDSMIQLLATHYHGTPIIYCYTRFFNEHLYPHFASVPLFVSHYSSSEPPLFGNTKPLLWQHSDAGLIDGISTPVDLDVFSEGTRLDKLKLKH